MAGARPGELFGCCAAVRCRAPELVATFEFTASSRNTLRNIQSSFPRGLGRPFRLLPRLQRSTHMTISHFSKPPGAGAPMVAGNVALDTAAATRLLVTEGILDYSGHISTRIPGRDAFVIQIGSTSRAEIGPESMLVVDYDGKVLEGDGQPPSELPIHLEILRARPDVQSVLHCHMELAIAFTMMQGVTLLPMRARAWS